MCAHLYVVHTRAISVTVTVYERAHLCVVHAEAHSECECAHLSVVHTEAVSVSVCMSVGTCVWCTLGPTVNVGVCTCVGC